MNWLRVIPAFQLSETVTRGQRGAQAKDVPSGFWLSVAPPPPPPPPPPAEGRAIIVLAKSWLG